VSEERVRVEVADHIADVCMVRGDKHNGLDKAMFEALVGAAEEVAGTPGARVAVIHGDGPSFCAGLDFQSFLAAGVPVEDMLEREDGDVANFAQRTAYEWRRLQVPVIAALHGACFGGGFQIALAADIRIAAPDTRMSVMEMRYGLIPDMSLSQTLPRLVRDDVARELVYTGRTVEAAEALELGLLTRIEDDPLAAARELAEEIAAKSPDAIRAAKRALNEAHGAPAAEGLALEEELQRALLGSPNQIAAVQAALSKQPAEFEDPA
jgi:enoyl-CoA hydratase/carnithine racemase